MTITQDQKDELKELLDDRKFDEFNAKCEEYGIELEAKPYTGYLFYRSNDFIADGGNCDLDDALKEVNCEVKNH